MSPDSTVTARLLVPLDGSPLAEQALPYALALMTSTSEVVLTQVVSTPEPRRDRDGSILAPLDAVLADEVTVATAALDQLAASWGLPTDRVQIEVAVGDPAAELLQVASARAGTLMIMGSHGRGALGRWRFGSVADRITRSTPIPVLIIRPRDAASAPEQAPARIARLLVPLDGSSLAETALPVAGELARQLQCPVNLVRVASPSGPSVMAVPGAGAGAGPVAVPIPPGTVGLIGEGGDGLEIARTYVEQVANHRALAGVTAVPEVLEGEAGKRLLEVAEPADLVVLTSHGRSGVARWLLGSVAEKLVRLAEAPVLLVPARPATGNF